MSHHPLPTRPASVPLMHSAESLGALDRKALQQVAKDLGLTQSAESADIILQILARQQNYPVKRSATSPQALPPAAQAASAETCSKRCKPAKRAACTAPWSEREANKRQLLEQCPASSTITTAAFQPPTSVSTKSAKNTVPTKKSGSAVSSTAALCRVRHEMHQTPVADRQHRHPQFMDSLTAHLLVRVSNQREADGGRLSQTLSVYLREQCAVWDRNTIWITASIATDCARPIVRDACSKADLRAPPRRCSASFQTRHCHSFSRSHWQPLVSHLYCDSCGLQQQLR